MSPMEKGRSAPEEDAMDNWDYRVMALASVLQCAQLIDRIARTGTFQQQEVSGLQSPLFVLDPRSNADVYQDPKELLPGLTLIETLASGGALREHQLVVQYCVKMLRLADTVRGDATLADQIRRGISAIQLANPKPESAEADGGELAAAQNADESAIDTISRALALVYRDTLSNVPRPIQIQGAAAALREPANAAAIRSLLLAGVRSALFWRQLGGRRWQLLLSRRRLAFTAARLKRQCIRSLH